MRQTRPREQAYSLTNSPAIVRARRVEGVQSSYFRRAAAGSNSPSITPVTTSGWRQLLSEFQQELDRLCLPQMTLRPSETALGFIPSHPNNNPPPIPTKALVLAEILHICDQVWRHDTFADGDTYKVNRSYPFDDSTYRPHDLLFPVCNLTPTPVMQQGGGHSSFGSMFRTGVVLDNNHTSQQQQPCGVRCPHPVTSHFLTMHGGFRRTPCHGFIHLDPPTGTSSTTDIYNWDSVDQCSPPMPPFGSAVRPGGVDATSSLAKLIGLYCTCLEVLGHHPRAPPHVTDVFMANCDGFGWRTDSNTVNSCMGAISSILNRQRQSQQRAVQGGNTTTAAKDTLLLMWDTMLTDAGLPMVERSVYNMCTDSLFSCFSAHNMYGCGAAALTFQNISENTEPPAVACETDDYYNQAYEAPPIPVRGLLRSPPHIISRGRNNVGSCMVVCPGGIDGPVITLVFIPHAVYCRQDLTRNEAENSPDNANEMEFQSLWQWFHRTALGVVPVSRRHIVVSFGKMEEMPDIPNTLPRSNHLLRVCQDRYRVESEYSKCNPLGFRYVCKGDATKTGLLDPFAPAVAFHDI